MVRYTGHAVLSPVKFDKLVLSEARIIGMMEPLPQTAPGCHHQPILIVKQGLVKIPILTCKFHHQSPVHISSNILFLPSGSLYAFSGAKHILFWKAGLPISLRMHSMGFLFHNCSASFCLCPFSSN